MERLWGFCRLCRAATRTIGVKGIKTEQRLGAETLATMFQFPQSTIIITGVDTAGSLARRTAFYLVTMARAPLRKDAVDAAK